MRQLTRNIKVLGIFGTLLIIYNVTFFYFRSYFHTHEQYSYIWISAFIFALAMCSTGFLFGNYCRLHKIGHFVAFLFHLMAYIIFNSIWLIWIFAGLSLKHDLRTVLMVIAAWGLGLLCHFLFFLMNRKYTIKGMDKDEIFE